MYGSIWSAERFGVQSMPFDGFLLATSRVMVLVAAKEARTPALLSRV